MHTLGKTSNGTKIDLVSFLDLICSDFTKLIGFVRRFLLASPEWKQLAVEAVQEYSDDLATIQPDEGSLQTAQELGRSIEQVLLANAISLVILFGYSHYLQWAGFDILEPTKFDEISEKLPFARKIVARMGFSLALGAKMDFEERYSPHSQATSNRYELGFGMGAALGYLTVEAHLRGPKVALDSLEKGTPRS